MTIHTVIPMRCEDNVSAERSLSPGILAFDVSKKKPTKKRHPREGGDPGKPASCYQDGMKRPCVYMLVNHPHGTFYVGVTSGLHERMAQHTQGLLEGFTKKHGIKMLIYYEMHETMEAAIKREKLLKRWNRTWKVRLIEQMNPEWRNLFSDATGEIAYGPTDSGQPA